MFAAQLAAGSLSAINRAVAVKRVRYVTALLMWGGVILVPLLLEDGFTAISGFGALMMIWFIFSAVKAWRPRAMDAAARCLKRERDEAAAMLGRYDEN